MCKQIWPGSQFPMRRVGRLVLNQNIQNFFNENEQLAFSPSHIVPGECPLQKGLTPKRGILSPAPLCRYTGGGDIYFYSRAKIASFFVQA